MPSIEFPQRRLALIHELGTRLLDSRKTGTPLETLSRDLLAGFHDICMATGLDRVLVELEQAVPELDITDRSSLADHASVTSALVTQLGAADLDGGGPRNVRPVQLADALTAALGLTIVDEADRTIALDGAVRGEVVAALASVIDVELALPRLRDSIVAKGRELCEERHHVVFDKIATQLDERGTRMLKQPKVPLDASQAVQRVLVEARNAVIGGAARTAIDRAKQVIERASAEGAARIDQPVTHRLTPREVAIARACDDRLPKIPPAVVQTLLDTLTDLSGLVWRAPEQVARPYGASQTFAVGEAIEHVKFGRGSVVAVQPKRIDVEFADGVHTLVHANK